MPLIQRVWRALRFGSGFAVIAILASAVPASAYCDYDQRGQRYCTDGGTTNAAPADLYAAIAVSETTLTSGVSWHAGSMEEAIRLAEDECRTQGASDCHEKIWRVNSCVALAISVPENAWAVDWGFNRAQAQGKAMAGCRTLGKSCVPEELACANDPTN
jgi:hypothetical protein